MKRYKVAISARPMAGQDSEQVRQRLCRLFKIPAEGGKRFFNGRAVVVKSDLERRQAEIIRQTIEKTGAECVILDQPQAPAAGQAEPSAAINFCPKCGSRLLSAETARISNQPTDECPSCGIVVAKYLHRQSADATLNHRQEHVQPKKEREKQTPFVASQSNQSSQSEQPIDQGQVHELFPAPLSRRFIASLFTAMYTASIYLPCYLVAFTFIYLSTRWRLGDASVQEITRILNSADSQSIVVAGLILIAVSGLSLIVVPFRQRQTWGQQNQGLRLVNETGQVVEDEAVYWLRSGATVLVYFSVGVLALVPLFNKRRRSLADLISRTHLAIDPEQKPQPFTGLAIIACSLVLFFGASVFGMVNSLEQAILRKIHPSPADRAAQNTVQTPRVNQMQLQEKLKMTLLAKRCQDGDEQACELLDQATTGK